MRFDKELLKGNISTVLLSMLTERPMYGYEFIKEVSVITDDLLNLKEGTLYPALHSLEKKGYINSFWETSSSGKPRKYYRLTPSGFQMFGKKRNEWDSFSNIMNKILSTQVLASKAENQ